jgi:hypothetical protein
MRGSSWVAVVLVDLLAMVFVELDHIVGAARLDLAMDMPHDIERAVGQRLDKLAQDAGS